MIPEAAVEAAAKAIWVRDHEELPWEVVGQARHYEYMVTARAALELASPHLMEQAWAEGWRAGAGWPQQDINPYRTTK